MGIPGTAASAGLLCRLSFLLLLYASVSKVCKTLLPYIAANTLRDAHKMRFQRILALLPSGFSCILPENTSRDSGCLTSTLRALTI